MVCARSVLLTECREGKGATVEGSGGRVLNDSSVKDVKERLPYQPINGALDRMHRNWEEMTLMASLTRAHPKDELSSAGCDNFLSFSSSSSSDSGTVFNLDTSVLYTTSRLAKQEADCFLSAMNRNQGMIVGDRDVQASNRQ